MRRISAWLSLSLCAAGLLTAIAEAAQSGRLIFLSTQLRPIEEAQKMRNLILKDFPREVDYITEQPQQFPVRIKAEEQGRTHTIDVVGALHGELQPLVPLDALVPLDDLAAELTGPGPAAVARQIRDRAPTLYPVDAGELHHGRQQSGPALSA
jgi:multiple sugar transport system substrate-binding protein